MARDWHAEFEGWGRPPSDAEETERRRTETELNTALERHRPLQDKRLRIYAKGSYRRGTNVRRGSDIDIAVELTGDDRTGTSFITEKAFDAAKLSDAELGLSSVTGFLYSVRQLKQDVFDALVSAYGSRAVIWSNKCIKVRERATTLPADVVPCRTHRRYDSRVTYHDGIEIHPDQGPVIVNWPVQDDENGTAKNRRTSLRFKRAVRGIKSLENEMVDEGAIKPVASFMMECAVYNVPDGRFDSSSNLANCIAALNEMQVAVSDAAIYNEWEEVNRLKYLFRPSQAWTVDDMRRLVDVATRYIGSR